MEQVVTWPYVLRRGHTDDPSQGACAMDAVNWLVHGKHGDAPECACPVIRGFVMMLNDALPDRERHRLLAYLPRIAGSFDRSSMGGDTVNRRLVAEVRGMCALGFLATPGGDEYYDPSDILPSVLGGLFALLDEMLALGPQGEPWSADVVADGAARFEAAGGRAPLRAVAEADPGKIPVS